MSKHRDFSTGDIFPAGFLDALNEFLGAQATPNLILDRPSTTSMRIAAGSGDDLRAVAIDGAWRYVTSNVTASAPANSAGTFPIYVTTKANNSSQEDAGTFDYSFGLKLSTTPSGSGSEALYRQIGTYDWDGSAITGWTQTVGPGPRRWHEVHTWAIPGPLNVVSGHSDYIPPFYLSLRSGQVARLVGAYAEIETGTSVNLKLRRKPWGSSEADVTGMTAMSITTTPSETLLTTPLGLAHKDRFRLVVNSSPGPSGSPQNLTFSVVVEHTAIQA
jgi:hypothetical protein